MPAHDADTDPTGAIFGGVSNRADISFSPVLRDSGAFEYTWKELSVWLEHLDNTKEDQKEAVIQFLERILLKLVTNPCPYTDKAADLVQAASVLQVALFKQDSDNISIPVSHIDGMW
ncbi:nucleolar pre-ribosomal-associated protein 1-like isoform 1-T1 [Acridotheres tristis]